mmetsp:Transcript_2092/g.8082  ORF Transcript_2092/g.8082 Transcript_2092/m.8082 type:complete len:377 (+) Transcript_2092:471-1601(+)
MQSVRPDEEEGAKDTEVVVDVGDDGRTEAVSSRTESGMMSPAAPRDAAVPQSSAQRKRPPKKLLKAVGEAIRDWGLIEDGDRVLLGLSGGKDSLSLLHVLLHLQRVAPVRFEVACATVDPATSSFDPSPLIPYVRGLGVEYVYLRDPIVEYAGVVQPSSLCAYCARMKRGALYSACLRGGFTKLALAHHLDDLAESFLMNVMHTGQLRTMRAKYTADRGVTVIRPLVYAREHLTADFAKSAGLPVIGENCPACFEEPKERARVKKLLAKEAAIFPNLFNSLRHALDPLMDDDVCAAVQHRMAALGEKQASRRAHRPPKSPLKVVASSEEDDVTGITPDPRLADFDDDALRAELERRARARRPPRETVAQSDENDDP